MRALARLEPRVTWILGGPRTGSSWLLDLLAHPLTADPQAPAGVGRRPGAARPRAIPVNEPYLGAHLAPVVSVHPAGVFTAADARAGDPSYFFDARWEAAWREPLRRLILARLFAQVDAAAREHGVRDPLVLVKEPNGSHGAPLIARALPRSRMLVLWRDGRDVLDSLLDAVAPGGWLAGGDDTADVAAGGERRRAFLRRSAQQWAHRTAMVRLALAAHDPARTLEVRYEALRADTDGELARIGAWLGIERGRAELDEVVATHAFDRYPDAVKGPGRPLRRAAPGGWRESLDPAEQEMVGALMRPGLEALGYV